MTFEEAISALKRGRYPRRAGWAEGEKLAIYIPFNGRDAGGLVKTFSHVGATRFCPTQGDLYATDWELAP
ncbi:uncharacterized protein DUF2829 [Methylorubrum extorquens]